MYEPNQSLYALYMHVHNATKFFNSAEQQNQRSWGPNLDDTNPIPDYFKTKCFLRGIAMLHSQKKENAPFPNSYPMIQVLRCHSRPVCARCLSFSHTVIMYILQLLVLYIFQVRPTHSASPVVQVRYSDPCCGQFIRHYPSVVSQGFLLSPRTREREIVKLQ